MPLANVAVAAAGRVGEVDVVGLDVEAAGLPWTTLRVAHRTGL